MAFTFCWVWFAFTLDFGIGVEGECSPGEDPKGPETSLAARGQVDLQPVCLKANDQFCFLVFLKENCFIR